jgi:hypothetical protein
VEESILLTVYGVGARSEVTGGAGEVWKKSIGSGVLCPLSAAAKAGFFLDLCGTTKVMPFPSIRLGVAQGRACGQHHYLQGSFDCGGNGSLGSPFRFAQDDRWRPHFLPR